MPPTVLRHIATVTITPLDVAIGQLLIGAFFFASLAHGNGVGLTIDGGVMGQGPASLTFDGMDNSGRRMARSSTAAWARQVPRPTLF